MWKNYKVPIRVDVLTVFVTLFVITILFIVTLTSIRSSSSLLLISEQLMSQASSSVLPKLSSLINPASSTSRLSAHLIKDGTLQKNNQTQMERYVSDLLTTIPQAEMAYWGDEQGNFIIARRGKGKAYSTEIINRNVTPVKRIMKYYNLKGQLIRQTPITNLDYDPRKRPWYIKAKREKKPTWSDAYIFYSGDKKTLGITSASPVYSDDGKLLGVFGIDIKLGALSAFLSKIHISAHSVVFIVNAKGQLIAFPGLEKLVLTKDHGNKLINIKAIKKPWLYQSYLYYKKTHKSKFSYNYHENRYLASYQSIPAFKQHQWSIVVIAPEDDFIGQLKKSNYITLLISIAILALGIILISALSKKISRPIMRLSKEVSQIELFHLEDTPKIDSHIKEIDMMSESIISMKRGLRSFQKYVPETLVRKLMHSKEAARVGGSKKNITVFFSDISNFTSISECLEPEGLMIHLCEYLDEMTKIILSQHGTVDKYIGDAIMAFWGAPILDKDHCLHACIAAVLFQKELTKLNKHWKASGKISFPTRIGIHTGDAIVGNLGSSERMNYTALGDTINIASRLEELNKVYGTHTIVSEDVKKIVFNHFYLRLLDSVAVKGRSGSLNIYELVRGKREELNEKIIAYCENFEAAFKLYQQQHWKEATRLFKNYLEIFPDDQATLLFIQRCEYFQKNPPAPDWDGVWRYKTKG